MLAAVDSYTLIKFFGAGRVGKLIQSEGPDSPQVLRQIDVLVNVARLDLLLLASIVFMMVTKVGD
jgi:hypothetical protein